MRLGKLIMHLNNYYVNWETENAILKPIDGYYPWIQYQINREKNLWISFEAYLKFV